MFSGNMRLLMVFKYKYIKLGKTMANKILTDYLTNENIISLQASYNAQHSTNFSFPPDEIKNNILQKIHTEFILNMFASFFGCNVLDINILGRGTQGYVISFASQKMQACIDSLSSVFIVEREKKSARLVPQNVAIKVQLLYTRNKFWEERIIKEEYILNKLSTIREIQPYIPKFYYGCTFNFNATRMRLTFMDIINPNEYVTITRIITNNGNISSELYKNLYDVVKLLWKHGVSHNNLSTNNILVNVINHKEFRLIDFGLAELILPNKITNNTTYIEYFKSLSKDSQNGSNVKKLADLFVHVKQEQQSHV